jgi:hypothetical protein
MKIFKQEIADGLETQLSTNASVSYAALVEPCASKSKIGKIKRKGIGRNSSRNTRPKSVVKSHIFGLFLWLKTHKKSALKSMTYSTPKNHQKSGKNG